MVFQRHIFSNPSILLFFFLFHRKESMQPEFFQKMQKNYRQEEMTEIYWQPLTNSNHLQLNTAKLISQLRKAQLLCKNCLVSFVLCLMSQFYFIFFSFLQCSQVVRMAVINKSILTGQLFLEWPILGARLGGGEGRLSDHTWN